MSNNILNFVKLNYINGIFEQKAIIITTCKKLLRNKININHAYMLLDQLVLKAPSTNSNLTRECYQRLSTLSEHKEVVPGYTRFVTLNHIIFNVLLLEIYVARSK